LSAAGAEKWYGAAAVADFEANRDITIEVIPAADGARLRSRGLARFAGVELEMIGVGKDHILNAGAVINEVADYAAHHDRLTPGERIAITSKNGSLVARLQQGPIVDGGGMFGRLMRRKIEVLRIAEPMDGMASGATLFSTVMLWRAAALVDKDDRDGARAELRRSIDMFPGEPDPDGEPDIGAPYNWQNHLSYAFLATLVEEPGERRALLESALARSRCFQVQNLGDPVESLVSLERAALLERAREIVIENCTEPRLVEVTQDVVIVTSPIRTRGGDGDMPLAVRRAALVPTPFTAYYYFEDTPHRLVSEPGVLEVAVDLLVENAGRPAQLLLVFDDVHRIYDGGGEESPAFTDDQPLPYRMGDTALSLALAHVARLVAAGMSVDELRAACHLAGADDAARASARDKLAALEHAEVQAMMAAMSV
jgi:hypothetical protein